MDVQAPTVPLFIFSSFFWIYILSLNYASVMVAIGVVGSEDGHGDQHYQSVPQPRHEICPKFYTAEIFW